MDEDFDMYRDVEQELARLVADLSPESYARVGPGLQEVGLAIAERREVMREFQRVQEVYQRIREDCERAQEDRERAREDKGSAQRSEHKTGSGFLRMLCRE